VERGFPSGKRTAVRIDAAHETGRSDGGGAIAHAAIKLGIEVYRAVAEGGRFD
jgi:hypothetical protein